jgi:hypothetical protein
MPASVESVSGPEHTKIGSDPQGNAIAKWDVVIIGCEHHFISALTSPPESHWVYVSPRIFQTLVDPMIVPNANIRGECWDRLVVLDDQRQASTR